MQHLLETLAVLGHVDHVGRRPDDRHAVLFKITRELERRLPAELHDDAPRFFDVNDLQHILERQRLEIETIGCVVIGRNGLGIAVDHDRLESVFAKRHRRMDAAIVEFDTLPDPIRSATQHDDFFAIGRCGLAFILVRRIHVGRLGCEFRRAGVDALEHRTKACRMPRRAHLRFGGFQQMREAPIGESLPLQLAQLIRMQRVQRAFFDGELEVDDLFDLREEPRVDLRVLVRFVDRHADRQRIGDVPQTLGTRIGELVGNRVGIDGLEIEAIDAALQAAQCLLQRFLERASDRHHLANGLHLRGEPVIGLLEFFEREAWDLGHDVIDGRLERSRHAFSIRPGGDVVLQFVERIADRQLGGNLGNRKPRGFRRQRRRARHARVHLDDNHPSIGWIDRKLHVRSAGVDANLAQDRDRRVAHDLVFLVGQRLRRRDGDRVAGVDAHRVQVLDRADDDAIVLAIADHLHLELFPAEQRFLDQQFVRRRKIEPALAHVDELVLVVRDATTGAAQCKGRADHRGEADLGLDFQRLLEVVRDARARRPEADARHRRLEFLAVLGLVDRFLRCSDQLDVELVQHAFPRQIERAVQRRLSTHRRQQRTGALTFDDLRDHRPRDRLDVRHIRHFRISHDRRRIRIDEDHAVSLFLQRLAGLRAGVVELASLSDDDRPRADDQNRFDVRSLGHGCQAAPLPLPKSLIAWSPSSSRIDRTDS